MPLADTIDRTLSAEDVATRFRQAKRSGTPSWLWPDIAITDWRSAQHRIADITRHALSGRRAADPATGDPAAFGLACYTSGMGPLLACWHNQGLLDASPEIAALLDVHARHNRARQQRLVAIATDLMQRFADAGIPLIILKGLHTATEYFPGEGTRPMADIDLLVAPSDAIAAETVLVAAGLAPGARRQRETHWHPIGEPARLQTLVYVHQDDPWSVDLHCSLDQFFATGSPLVRFDVARPFQHSRALTRFPGAAGLEQPLLLLHIATHAGGGLHNLTLLRLTELNLVIRQDQAAGRLSWPQVIEIGAATGALGYVYPALQLCEALMPGTVPGQVLRRCAAAAPQRVLRFVATLTPATAQRVDRSSIAEHFMWTSGWQGRLRQIAADFAPAPQSWQATRSIFERRVWQVLRGRIGA